MHLIEPFYNWRNLYVASEDERSPFFEVEYSEFEFTNQIYNYVIHPQWDQFGSATLYLKVLFVDYEKQFCIIEFIGEWNDCLYNDIMFLYRNVIEALLDSGINKYILIGENVLNFHYSDDSYYQEWCDEIEDGWIACINFRLQVVREFENGRIDYFMAMGGKFDNLPWRTVLPEKLFLIVENMMMRRLNP